MDHQQDSDVRVEIPILNEEHPALGAGGVSVYQQSILFKPARIVGVVGD